MHALVERARAFRQSPHFPRTIKFATVSVISTVVSQTILFLTFDLDHLASAMVCNVIATGAATVPAYWLNRTWTWGKRGKSSFWRELAPFWAIAFVGLVLSTIAVGVAAHNADHISNSRAIKDLVVHGANFVTYGLIWIARYTIFNKFMFGSETAGDGVIDTVAVDTNVVTAAPALDSSS